MFKCALHSTFFACNSIPEWQLKCWRYQYKERKKSGYFCFLVKKTTTREQERNPCECIPIYIWTKKRRVGLIYCCEKWDLIHLHLQKREIVQAVSMEAMPNEENKGRKMQEASLLSSKKCLFNFFNPLAIIMYVFFIRSAYTWLKRPSYFQWLVDLPSNWFQHSIYIYTYEVEES